MSLGSKIKELRIKKGLTQSDLGSGLVTPSMISQIESDKANPSYKVLEAIAERLEEPLEYLLVDLESQLEHHTAHKVAKALISSGAYDRAVDLLTVVVQNPASNLNLVDVKNDLGKCLLELNRHDEACGVLNEAVEFAIEKLLFQRAITALNILGILEHRRKKHHRAIYYWRKGYDLFPQMPAPEPFLQGELLNNLGSIHHDLGEAHDALSYYQEAKSLLADTDNLEQIGNTYLGLASFRQTREYDLATEYAGYAVALFESVRNMKLAIEVKRNFATMNQNVQAHVKVLESLEECLEQCKTLRFKDEAATIYGDIALLHIQRSQPHLSLKAVEEGLEVSTVGSATAARLFKIKGLALANLDMHVEAIRAFENAVALFKSHNMNAELTECYSLLAEVHQKAGDVKTAYDCLYRMRQVLQESLKDRGFVITA
ncbi:helix-turn-helix domain-containing protein [Tumebacillus sp. ITR2]|uniref:Helix-turn-helix domain-containing protein n=1 Tax=Tumebacillus amylolyticus TaxID=2801339 RepID=A0ABS1J700_9BACL|nr:helix-turn-helix domain-containing protein [Tumebacillus amylolyticus]MBL0386065.1 helix-turn-helix domain-containing protein [Tumebacillus amylolyticus]